MTTDTLWRTITELVKSVNLLHRNGLHIPSVMMTYAAIDILAALARPANAQETSGANFRAWVDQYLLPGSRLKCNADDIWGARCGLLHTYAPESRHSRDGRARKLVYAIGVLDESARGTTQFVSGEYVTVVSQDLFDALSEGLKRFMDAFEADPELRERVTRHTDEFLVPWVPTTEQAE